MAKGMGSIGGILGAFVAAVIGTAVGMAVIDRVEILRKNVTPNLSGGK